MKIVVWILNDASNGSKIEILELSVVLGLLVMPCRTLDLFQAILELGTAAVNEGRPTLSGPETQRS